VTPDGFALGLDLGIYPDCCMAVGLYELDTDRQLRRQLKGGSWFVDCGANLGYFTLLACKLVGPQGRIDAFEPDPINRQRLEEHLRNNHVEDRVRIHAQALADRPGELTLYHPTGGETNHGMASFYATLVPTSQPYQVAVVRLDEQLDGIPDLIKLDVEGAELAAVEGMEKLLGAPRPPKLIIEHNPSSCAAAGYKPSDLYRKLKSLQPNYTISWIGRRLQPISTPEDLDHMSRQGNLLVAAPDDI